MRDIYFVSTMSQSRNLFICRIIFVFVLVVSFCDIILFPYLFADIIHSRYFSYPCNDEIAKSCIDLEDIFLRRRNSCDVKAKAYWTSMEPYDHKLKPPAKTRNASSYINHTDLDLLVMIITIRRRGQGYLKHIAKLLNQQIIAVNNQSNINVHLVICNADAELTSHRDAIYLSNYVDTIAINNTERSHKCCKRNKW